MVKKSRRTIIADDILRGAQTSAGKRSRRDSFALQNIQSLYRELEPSALESYWKDVGRRMSSETKKQFIQGRSESFRQKLQDEFRHLGRFVSKEEALGAKFHPSERATLPRRASRRGFRSLL